jgi:trehalose-6-phosphate synthase
LTVVNYTLSAIAQALSMPLEERHSRHDAMFQVLLTNDVESWGERFLIALTRPVNLPNWQTFDEANPIFQVDSKVRK